MDWCHVIEPPPSTAYVAMANDQGSWREDHKAQGKGMNLQGS